MPILFERMQWPVGHGGFHTGRLIARGKTTFSYFYDCGSHAPKRSGAVLRISEELASTEYDVGVLSHFDHDHFASIGSSAPRVLYLPYMTRTDQLLHMLLSSKGTPTGLRTQASVYETLNRIKNDGTKIIMVSGGDNIRSEGNEGQITQVAGRQIAECAFPVMSHTDIPHQDNCLRFKFFNHYADDLSKDLFVLLIAHLAKFRDKAGNSYPSEQALLCAIEDEPASTVACNAKVFKAVYVALVAARPVSGITASNLSSLVLLSFCEEPRSHAITVRCAPRQYVHARGNAGWLLTGDLEMKNKVWPAFYAHYASELLDCLVFNLPHHASSVALNWRAMHHLSPELVYLANVNSADKKHPSRVLYAAMDDFMLQKRHAVTEKPFSAFTVNVQLR
jgi:hypothetical protein